MGLDRSLFLVGFMGAGKSLVGPLLAKELSLPFVDLDETIVHETGKTIADIFRDEGEPAFRNYERTVLASLALPAVIALGGGAFIQPEVRRFVRKKGLSLFLDWPGHVLFERVAGDPERPLAIDREKLTALLETRLPVYREADLIWTSRPPHHERPEEITRAVAPSIKGEMTREWIR
jgi:shikimate kinase